MDSQNIDEIDRRILHALQSDARRTNKDLAEAVGLAPSTTLGRVRELERSGIVRGYHADVAPWALGHGVEAMVSVRLSPKNDDVVQTFVDTLLALPEVIGVFLLTGPYDVLVHVSVAGIAELRTLVLDRVAGFEGVVDEQTMIVFEHLRKHVLEPARTVDGR